MSQGLLADLLTVGMVTPVGLCALQTATSVRAGITRVAESYLSDRYGEPLVMGLVDQEQLPPLAAAIRARSLSPRMARLVRLGGAALAEAMAPLPKQPLPLLLGIGEPCHHAHHPIDEGLLSLVAEQAQCAIDTEHSQVLCCGRAAGLLALDAGVALLNAGVAPAIVVGGVDSYLDQGRLSSLDKEGRLKTGAISDGFVPGEGAAFVVIAKPDAPIVGVDKLARLVGIGHAVEEGHFYSPQPHRGDGLSAAIAAALDGACAGGVTPCIVCTYGGLNGESYWGREWGVAQVRAARYFGPRARLEHPVDCMGDPGAALGPILLGLGALSLSARRIAGHCLVWAAADGPQRGAALLAARV